MQGWKSLPKSFMNQNAVFLLLTALIRNFYEMLKDRIGEGQTQDFLTEKGKPCQDLRLPLRLSACEMGSDGTPACPEHLHQQ